MSFQEIGDIERGSTSALKRNGESSSQPLAAGLFQMTTQISSLRRLVSLIGTPKDSPEIRDKIHRLRQQLTTLAKQTGISLKQAYSYDQSQSAERGKQLADAKLARDFELILKEFGTVQRLLADKEAQFPRIETRSSNLGGNIDSIYEGEPLMTSEQQSELLSVENELVYNEAVIEERDEGIREIEKQIGEVHEIFKDLATLVKEQGTMIDDLEASIEGSHVNVQQGNKQLSGALRKHKTANTLTCWAILVFCIIMFVLFLVLSI